MLLFGEITLAGLLTDVGSVFTSFTGYVGSICSTIVDNPLLLLGFCVPFSFIIIALVRRLFHIA